MGSMKDRVYYPCIKCNFDTHHKTKYQRHLGTLKHKIATDGYECCNLTYYSKHQWVNHKKSKKHQKCKKEVNKEVIEIKEIKEAKEDQLIRDK